MKKAHLVIGTVSMCNARCITCPTTRDTEGIMSFELWKSIVDQIRPIMGVFGQCWISIFGEPLLDRGIFRKVDYYRSVFPKKSWFKKRLPFYLDTTAFLLDKQHAERVIEGFDGIIIHIESCREEIYKKLMPGLDFDRVLKNTRNLVEIRKRYDDSFLIQVATPCSRYNSSEMEEYEIFWKNEGVDKVSFVNLSNRSGVLQTFDDLKVDNGIDVKPNCSGETANDLIIDWDGKVLLCCQDFHRQLILGDITENPISVIYSSQQRREIARLLDGNKHNEIVTCQACCINVAIRDG